MIKQSATTGNHHLSTVVIALTAILLALGIYTYTYSHRSTGTVGTNSTATASASTKTARLADTIAGAASFTGTIPSVKGQNQLTVTTVVVTHGVPATKTLIVNFTKQTTITAFAYAPSTPAGTEVTQTASDASALKQGVPVQVHTNEIVGSTSPLTANAIDILPS
jgi:hypothetical protein